MVEDKLTLLTEEAREPDSITAQEAERILAEAATLAAPDEPAFAKKRRALERARALKRIAAG
jgi:predicted aconitase with swiveling domain